MATFKVGQRVKRVRDPHLIPASDTDMPLGAVGTVTDPNDDGCVRVKRDGSARGAWGCDPGTLEAAVDPKADEFIAKLKKLGQEPVTLTTKQLDEVRSA